MGHAAVWGQRVSRALTLVALLAYSGCKSRPTSSTPARALEPSGAAGPDVRSPDTAITGGEPDITSYVAQLELDVPSRSLSGTAILSYDATAPRPVPLRLPHNALRVDAVSARGHTLPFRIDGASLVIDLPAPGGSGSPDRPGVGQIEIAYRAASERGLVFGPKLVYTNFDTCHWLPCKEEPGDKASFRLELIVPEPMSVVASGELVEKSPAGLGRTRFVWLERRPHSTYLFGFAAGEFTEATLPAGHTALRLLGVDLPAAELERRFRPSEGMLRFLESKATLRLPRPIYTQILVPGSQAQEKSSFSLIGRDELDPILSDPTEDWVIVHELAHQWWGNLITCKDWSHFWLNEGITSFMVAAYKEQRWGASAYERELALFRRRHQAAVDAKFDVKLTFAGAYPSLRMKRAITYSKAALFLHTLRQELGDDAFWAGLGRFTRERAGQSVESRDFEQDVTKATGRDLSSLFQTWVYD
jgi:aminopeptidase N